jgi:DNA repair protein RadC
MNTTTNVLISEMPQARFDTVGGAGLSDTELLALLLGGTPGAALELARKVVLAAGSLAALAALARWSAAEFRSFGVGEAKARQLGAMAEVSRRMLNEAPNEVMNRPEKIYSHFRTQIIGLVVEKFWVLCLNRKNRLIQQVEITSGTATSSLAHPREVFRAAVRAGATAVVCVHNHPSGDPAPSAADVQVTRQLREAAKALDIDLLDHVVVGLATNDPQGRGYYSFREAGIL